MDKPKIEIDLTKIGGLKVEQASFPPLKSEELKSAVKIIREYCKKTPCHECEIKHKIGCCGPSYEEMEGLPEDWKLEDE